MNKQEGSSNDKLLFAEERKEIIVDLLNYKSKISCSELCKMFNVSSVTVRNDLQDLENAGLLKRTHGGAIHIRKAALEPTSAVKCVENIEQKRRIAKMAAKLVEDGDTIAIDTGTTTFEFAKEIAAKNNLTILTNDLKIATYLEDNSNAGIIVLGGILRRGFNCTVNHDYTSRSDFYVDKAFIGTNGFTVDNGFTTPDILQAEVKKKLIDIASDVTFIFDSSKTGKVFFAKFADVDSATRIVIDDKLNKKIADLVTVKNVELIYS